MEHSEIIALNKLDSLKNVKLEIYHLLRTWVILASIRDRTLEWDDRREIDDDKNETFKKKKTWSRKRKTKQGIKTGIELENLYCDSEFLANQFKLHFSNSASQKNLPSRSQTALLQLLAFFHSNRIARAIRQNSRFGNNSAMIDADEFRHYDGSLIRKEWIDQLSHLYSGSLSDFDRYCRILLINPNHLIEVPLIEWINRLHDFREISCEFIDHNEIESHHRLIRNDSRRNHSIESTPLHWNCSTMIDWLQLNPQRRIMTRTFFPINRQFDELNDYDPSTASYSPFDESHLLPMEVAGAQLIDVPGMKANVGLDRSSTSWLVYDPAMLIPYLAGRLRVAWIVVEEVRRNMKRRSGGPIHHLLEFYEPELKNEKQKCMEDFDEYDEKMQQAELSEKDQAYRKILKEWRTGLDLEGVWLRRIASGGTLEMLIIGLICSVSTKNVIFYIQFN